jgi:hypothetical protein
MRVAMRKPAAVAVALSLGLVAPALAADTDPHASCSAKLSTMFTAGEPGARADVSHDARAEANSIGLTLGDFQSEVAHDHGPAELC